MRISPEAGGRAEVLVSKTEIRIADAPLQSPAELVEMLAARNIGKVRMHAARADRTQPARIASATMEIDLTSGAKILTGNVELRRGTLLITAEKALVTEDAQGYGHVVLTARPSGPSIAFRQKLDGEGDVWIEGSARKAEPRSSSTPHRARPRKLRRSMARARGA